MDRSTLDDDITRLQDSAFVVVEHQGEGAADDNTIVKCDRTVENLLDPMSPKNVSTLVSISAHRFSVWGHVNNAEETPTGVHKPVLARPDSVSKTPVVA